MKKFFKRFLPLLLLVIIIAAVWEFARLRNQATQAILPKSIKQQLAMPAVVPADKFENYTLSPDSIKYDEKEKLLSYALTNQNSSITITQQPYPDILIYDKLKNAIQQYKDVDTQIGKATLGRPKDGGGQQIAVLNYNNQTLIFAKPQKDLSEDQWRQLFNNMEPIK